MYDLIIIGAGPGGIALAANIGKPSEALSTTPLVWRSLPLSEASDGPRILKGRNRAGAQSAEIASKIRTNS
jgi:NADH dehydrogenase FAD-containing subunit